MTEFKLDNPRDGSQDEMAVTVGGLVRAGANVLTIPLKVATVPFKIIGAVADEIFADDGRVTKRGGGFKGGDWGRHR